MCCDDIHSCLRLAFLPWRGVTNESPNYKATLLDLKFDKWFEAMNTDMQFMKDNQVWVLVDLPPNGRTIRSKWLFKKKTDMDGNVHTFKAYLLAKGYTQAYGVDYAETFSPFVDIRAIRILLAIAVFYDYEICKHLEVGIKADLKVSCYADASFQTNKDDTKSQTGYVFVLNGGVMDWKSAKQSTTAMSSIEAEYITAAEASMEAVWMRKFIDGLRNVVLSNKSPMEMLCDNEPAIAISNDLRILKGAIHFQRKCHYIREVIQEREIVLKKVHTNDNVADPFTKRMSSNKHYEHAMAIGIVPTRSLM
ncbi:putative retrotransposon protein [Tanacetum coccineum]